MYAIYLFNIMYDINSVSFIASTTIYDMIWHIYIYYNNLDEIRVIPCFGESQMETVWKRTKGTSSAIGAGSLKRVWFSSSDLAAP